MQITLEQARAFCAVVEAGGYLKAAERLHKSHPALVYMVKSLEEQCRVKLFDREGYRNTLTPAGRRVYLKCVDLLSKVEELSVLCGQISDGWEGAIKIIFDGIMPFDPFLKLYKKFKSEQIPTIVQTYSDYLDGVETSFDKLKADMMISIVPVSDTRLEKIFLKPFEHLLVAHKDHPVHEAPRKNSIEYLKKFDFLTIRGAGGKLGLNTPEFEESATFFLGDFSFKKEAILKKAGFGWLPSHLIGNELRSKTLVPIKWERPSRHEIQPVLYCRKGVTKGRAMQVIMDHLLEE